MRCLFRRRDQYLRIGDFAMVTITDASEFDLVGEMLVPVHH